MRNCINIIKYNLKNHKVLYIVELAVLLTCLIAGIGSKKIITFSLLNAANGTLAAFVIIVINTVVQIVLTCKEVKKENGNLLFTVPIKGWEYILAKVLEVFLVNLVVFAISALSLGTNGGVQAIIGEFTMGTLNGSSIGSMAVWGVLLSVVSYSSWLIVLLMIIVTAASYIEKNGLRVLAVVGFETIGLSIYSLLIAQITNIIPKINLVIQTGNKINLVEVIINLIVIVGLGYFSARSIDEKLSIY